jgi:hypothetical protein
MLCVIVPLVYGPRPNGKGREAGKAICAVLHIPQPPASFSIYNKTVDSAVAEVSVSSKMQAARESVQENKEGDSSNITTFFMTAGKNVDTLP